MAALTKDEQAFLDANIEGTAQHFLTDAERARYKGLRAKELLDQTLFGRLVASRARGEPQDPADQAAVRATPDICSRSADWLLASIADGTAAATGAAEDQVR